MGWRAPSTPTGQHARGSVSKEGTKVHHAGGTISPVWWGPGTHSGGRSQATPSAVVRGLPVLPAPTLLEGAPEDQGGVPSTPSPLLPGPHAPLPRKLGVVGPGETAGPRGALWGGGAGGWRATNSGPERRQGDQLATRTGPVEDAGGLTFVSPALRGGNAGPGIPTEAEPRVMASVRGPLPYHCNLDRQEQAGGQCVHFLPCHVFHSTEASHARVPHTFCGSGQWLRLAFWWFLLQGQWGWWLGLPRHLQPGPLRPTGTPHHAPTGASALLCTSTALFTGQAAALGGPL